MKRYPHYYWPKGPGRNPSRIAVLDCDTTHQSARVDNRVRAEQLACWSLLTAEIRHGAPAKETAAHGQTVPHLWAVLARLLRSNDRTYLYLVGAGKLLSLIGFWERMEQGCIALAGRDWRTTDQACRSGEDRRDGVCILDDPPTVIVCYVSGRPGKLIILDVRNYGIDTQSVSGDCVQRASWHMHGLGEVVRTLWDDGKRALRCTAASQAMSSLRQADGVRRLHCHTHPGALSLERSAYYGGRCECYRLGEVSGPVYHLDVRSMYPALCRTLPIPISMRGYHDAGASDRTGYHDRPENCIAHVRLRCPMPAYPLRREWGVCYPVGEFDTFLAGPELCRAAREHRITRWYSCAEYTTSPILSGYYEQWFAMLASARARRGVFLEQFLKRMMVSLVGKFGETGRRWVPTWYRSEFGPWKKPWPDVERGEPCRLRNIGGYTQREEIYGESYHSMPSIAAFITSAGRMQLHDYILIAGWENIWYCDTDAILTNRAGYEALLHIGAIRDGESGHLRLIGTYQRCFIHGIRHYECDGSIKCAGPRHGEIRAGETRGEYWERIRIRDEIYLGRRPRGQERRVIIPGVDDYRHGRVTTGGRVEPWEIYD